MDARLSVWKYDDAYQAMLAHAPEAPTNHDVAQLQARVAELEAAINRLKIYIVVLPDVLMRDHMLDLVAEALKP